MQSDSDHCLFVKPGDANIIILIWVDDIVIASSNIDYVNFIKRELSSNFSMKDFGVISNFLGIEFIFEFDHIKMCQIKYTEKILNRFNMKDCHPKCLPCDANTAKIDLRIILHYWLIRLYIRKL